MRAIAAFALILGVLGAWPDSAEARYRTVVGSWIIEVTPQPAAPGFPEPPPPFVSIFNFGLGKTVTETDSSVHPGSMLLVFPDLPPLSASDGYGAWKRVGRNRFKTTFLKILFDDTGMQIGFVKTTLDLTLGRGNTLQGKGTSEFIEGSDTTAPGFFTGPVTLQGKRLAVEN